MMDLAAERAAYLLRQWPTLREARARSVLEELVHRDPHQPGGAAAITEETIREAAVRRCRDQTPERVQEVVQRALDLFASGTVRPRARPKARSARSTKGGRR